MESQFSTQREPIEEVVTLDGKDLPQVSALVPWSIIQRNRDIDQDVTERITSGWLEFKWRAAIGLFCNCRVPSKLREDSIGWQLDKCYHMGENVGIQKELY